MSRLRKDAKKSCQKQGPHANVLKTGQSQQCERQATEHVGKRGLPEGRQLGVDVGIQRPKDGGVARNELRHDTTSSLRIDEQEDEVQEQQAQQALEGAPLAPGNDATLARLRSRAQEPRAPLPPEITGRRAESPSLWITICSRRIFVVHGGAPQQDHQE